jgi:choline dehydrogenase-like flavoprotein
MIPYSRGRVIGGSSAVNAAIALRGVPADYDEWAALGNPIGAGNGSCRTSVGSKTTRKATITSPAAAARSRSAAGASTS